MAHLKLGNQAVHRQRISTVMSSGSPAKPKSLEEKLRMLAEVICYPIFQSKQIAKKKKLAKFVNGALEKRAG